MSHAINDKDRPRNLAEVSLFIREEKRIQELQKTSSDFPNSSWYCYKKKDLKNQRIREPVAESESGKKTTGQVQQCTIIATEEGDLWFGSCNRPSKKKKKKRIAREGYVHAVVITDTRGGFVPKPQHPHYQVQTPKLPLEMQQQQGAAS